MLRTLTFALLLLPAAASARDWAVDASKSTLGFKGSYQGEAFTGSFRTFDATIAYDAADPSKGKFDVSVDLASASGDGRSATLAAPSATVERLAAACAAAGLQEQP